MTHTHLHVLSLLLVTCIGHVWFVNQWMVISKSMTSSLVGTDLVVLRPYTSTHHFFFFSTDVQNKAAYLHYLHLICYGGFASIWIHAFSDSLQHDKCELTMNFPCCCDSFHIVAIMYARILKATLTATVTAFSYIVSYDDDGKLVVT